VVVRVVFFEVSAFGDVDIATSPPQASPGLQQAHVVLLTHQWQPARKLPRRFIWSPRKYTVEDSTISQVAEAMYLSHILHVPTFAVVTRLDTVDLPSNSSLYRSGSSVNLAPASHAALFCARRRGSLGGFDK